MTPDIGLTSDVGREREINQDSAGVTEVSPGVWLLVVADGMGGHVAGEQAARIVVESLFAQFEDNPTEDPRDNLFFGIEAAHKKALAYAEAHGTQGMGSTVVAALLEGDRVWVAHVGDSRLYQFRDGQVVFATTDHTRVQMMLEMGLLTPEQAKDHPEGNVITRAVGHDPTTRGATFAADVQREPISLQDGDSLLLCSDGLYDLVDDQEMIENIAGRPAEEGTQRLVALANRRGGHDNITVLVLHVGSGTSAPTPPPFGLPTDGYRAPGRNTVEEPAFTTLEDSIEAPALPDEGDEDAALAMVRTSEHTAVVLPVAKSDRSLRWAVLALSGLVVLLVGVVIFLVARPGPAATAVDPTPVAADDDDSARDDAGDDDSGDDDSGDDDSSVVGDDDSGGS
jgi:PPM family protein phosphatase